jgi:hypothetical protein
MIVRDLNQAYNLGLRLDDSRTFTLSEAKDLARHDLNLQRCRQIEGGVRFLYYRGAWDTALRAFRREARAVSQGWIHKPEADPDLLPSSTELFKAKTPGEQLELQDLLLEQVKQVIESVQASESAHAETPKSAVSPRTNGSRSKRQSTELIVEIPAGASKRRKSQDVQPKTIAVYSSIDKVPLRQKFTLARKESSALSAVTPGRPFYDQSDNSSKSSLQPSIFSVAGNNGLPASQQTQTTVGNDSQPKPKPFHQPDPPSSFDLFAPSSGDIEALEVSFSRLVEEQALEGTDDVPSEDPREWSQSEPELPTIHTRGLARDERGHSATISTKNSSCDASPGDNTPVPELRTPTPLDNRLKNVWRRLLFPSFICRPVNRML